LIEARCWVMGAPGSVGHFCVNLEIMPENTGVLYARLLNYILFHFSVLCAINVIQG
jgi:hypothetical protein